MKCLICYPLLYQISRKELIELQETYGVQLKCLIFTTEGPYHDNSSRASIICMTLRSRKTTKKVFLAMVFMVNRIAGRGRRQSVVNATFGAFLLDTVRLVY